MLRTLHARLLAALALIGPAVSCDRHGGTAAPPATMATIRVDDLHSMTSPNAAAYEIAPAAGVMLDLTGYEIKAPANVSSWRGVNAIQVVGAKNLYSARWMDGGTSQTLSSATLKLLKGNRAFEGMKAGEDWMIAFGAERRAGGRDGKIDFYPCWVASVHVREQASAGGK